MVQEEVDIGADIGTVQAVDEDIDENGMIDYLITCKFSNNPFSVSLIFIHFTMFSHIFTLF